MADALEHAQNAYETFCSELECVILGTVDENGAPNASYTPYYQDENKNVYVLISTMSKHARNLMSSTQVSTLFLEDESKTKQMYARRRLSYECTSEKVEVGSDVFESICEKLQDRFGKIIVTLKDMSDFHVFKLTPSAGRFVIGFGKAYDIKGEDLNTLVHLTGSGHGHGHSRSKNDEALTDDVKKRIMDHMNDDHVDAIVGYASFHAGVEGVSHAQMVNMDEEGMELRITQNGIEEHVRVAYTKPVTSAGDAHQVLVAMAKEAKGATKEEVVS